MDRQHRTSLLHKLPGEIRNKIWTLLCTTPAWRPYRERFGPTTGILNCNKYLSQEFSSFLFHQNPRGEIPSLTIVITATCRREAWLSLAIEPQCPMANSYHFSNRIDNERCFDVNDMDNPVFDVLREAKQINVVNIRFEGPWFVNDAPLYSLPEKQRAPFGEDPIYDAEAFWRQWDVPFLCHWAKAQDVARLLGSFQRIGQVAIHFNDWGRDSRRDGEKYWHAIPFYTSIKDSELRNPAKVWRLLIECFSYGDADGMNLLNIDSSEYKTLFGIITFPTKKNPEGGLAPRYYHEDGLADRLEGLGPIKKPQTLEEAPKHHVNRLFAAFTSLLEQQSDDIYDVWALREHRAATLDSSPRNFFHRLQRQGKYPIS
ncbi:hypothetical protein HER10_EVM0004775 [Colletotrichum scovillei]|uniref:Uncharacterized protein n=1 Tax=Colletotrichum scovillei TaxID=1209932 RepID=A0A9P7RFS1_9PEZI|nr:uncharacterized protein HER10_EVM0004775 [Colletotrichum scovillei]KAF4779534.1 hypothetical protein HER10_EVM0004775 [Colletotrichum scovillei]KAG7057322.1 hypothetical protein JMJ77_0004711 [Colletotrichum scovillei]KAG7075920.1 hypothetical protein JMJ76_0013194 [Colletotrichum scovillei]KAG7083097.1 hypothetical protein JMJ78_0008547 [Colletotrichum scovillei]